MENIFLSILSILIILTATMIILAKNPVHSILFLVIVFVCTTGLLILLGAEFVGMLFLVVYVGAITVLFLFVVMMLNIKIIELNERFVRYLPIGAFLGVIFLLEIIFLIDKNFITHNLDPNENYFLITNDFLSNISSLVNIEQIGLVLYTKFVYLFLLSGMILLIAMLGAIVLTLNQKLKNKRQDYYSQTNKSINNSIRFLK